MIHTIIIIAVLLSIVIIFTLPSLHTLQVNNNNSTDFIFSFDFTNSLRGAAILMVMVGHVSGMVNNFRIKDVIITACILFVVGTLFLLIKQHPIVRAQMSTWIYNVVQLFFKLPYAVLLVCLLRLFPQCIKSKFLLFSGILCYELYLVHMSFWNNVENTVWSEMLLFIVSLAISYPFYLLNNKIKSVMSFIK